MGRALPGIDLSIDDGELVADAATVPTFFLGYQDGDAIAAPATGPWHTGDRVTRDEDGYLYFEGRTDDVIISAGYRIGPFEVESALVAHEAVAEAAVVAAPDDERGSIVRAVVVLRDGFAGSDDLARALQDHVKAQTAPYKYPRRVDFADELPKTASGKVRRALLREDAIARFQRLVPSWYHQPMAMNLRLDDDEMAALRRRAEQEGRSMQEVAKSAIHEYVSGRPERLRAAIERIRTEDAELLDRLSK